MALSITHLKFKNGTAPLFESDSTFVTASDFNFSFARGAFLYIQNPPLNETAAVYEEDADGNVYTFRISRTAIGTVNLVFSVGSEISASSYTGPAVVNSSGFSIAFIKIGQEWAVGFITCVAAALRNNWAWGKFYNGVTLGTVASGNMSFPAGTTRDDFISQVSNFASYMVLDCTSTSMYGLGSGTDSNTILSGTVPLSSVVVDLLQSIEQDTPVGPTSTDPYSWTVPTTPSEPYTGDHTRVQNDIAFPTLPTDSMSNAGFVSIWIPTMDQIQKLARYTWTLNPLTVEFWKKLVASPLDLIFGLSIIPYDFRDSESQYTVHTDKLNLGYVNTQIDMDYIDEQFIEVDMGIVDLTEWAGAYLDYSPYTKISIYLPYIGTRELSADDCMDAKIELLYRIDLGSGACVAMLKCDKNNNELDSVLYTFSGACATQIPVTASQMQELFRSIVSIGSGIALGVATGGAAGVIGAAGATVNGALNLKPHYGHTGNLGSSAGLMAIQKPYLIMSRPRLAIPENQNIYMGYPSFITEELGSIEGFTQVEVTHLDGMTCTEDEVIEIERLLKEGVIF